MRENLHSDEMISVRIMPVIEKIFQDYCRAETRRVYSLFVNNYRNLKRNEMTRTIYLKLGCSTNLCL